MIREEDMVILRGSPVEEKSHSLEREWNQRTRGNDAKRAVREKYIYSKNQRHDQNSPEEKKREEDDFSLMLPLPEGQDKQGRV